MVSDHFKASLKLSSKAEMPILVMHFTCLGMKPRKYQRLTKQIKQKLGIDPHKKLYKKCVPQRVSEPFIYF